MSEFISRDIRPDAILHLTAGEVHCLWAMFHYMHARIAEDMDKQDGTDNPITKMRVEHEFSRFQASLNQASTGNFSQDPDDTGGSENCPFWTLSQILQEAASLTGAPYFFGKEEVSQSDRELYDKATAAMDFPRLSWRAPTKLAPHDRAKGLPKIEKAKLQ